MTDSLGTGIRRPDFLCFRAVFDAKKTANEIFKRYFRPPGEPPTIPTMRSAGYCHLFRKEFIYDETSNHLSFIWIQKGAIYIQTDGAEFAVEEGKLCIINPPAYIHISKITPEVECCWLTIDGNKISGWNLCHRFWTGIFKYDEAPIQRICELGEGLREATTQESVRAVSDHALSLLDSIEINIRHHAESRPSIKANALVHSVIDKNFLSVEWLASEMGMHRKSLYTLFKQEEGCSPCQYIMRVRMNRICRLLRYSDLDLNQLVAATSYVDTAYFTKMFPKLFGKTIAEFHKHSCCEGCKCPQALCTKNDAAVPNGTSLSRICTIFTPMLYLDHFMARAC